MVTWLLLSWILPGITLCNWGCKAPIPDHDKADHDRSILCNTVSSAFRSSYVSFWHITGRFTTQTAFNTKTYFAILLEWHFPSPCCYLVILSKFCLKLSHPNTLFIMFQAICPMPPMSPNSPFFLLMRHTSNEKPREGSFLLRALVAHENTARKHQVCPQNWTRHIN